MKKKLKVRKIGNSYGIVIPKEILNDLQVEEGQSLYMTKSPDGYMVTQADEQFEKTMAVFEDISKRYRNTLRELSK